MSHLRGRSGGGSPSAGPSPPAQHHSRQRFPPPAWRRPVMAGVRRRTWRPAALSRPRGRPEAAVSGAAASRGTSWARSTACHPRRARSIPFFAASTHAHQPDNGDRLKKNRRADAHARTDRSPRAAEAAESDETGQRDGRPGSSVRLATT